MSTFSRLRWLSSTAAPLLRGAEPRSRRNGSGWSEPHPDRGGALGPLVLVAVGTGAITAALGLVHLDVPASEIAPVEGRSRGP
jgi:hypothetical protein